MKRIENTHPVILRVLKGIEEASVVGAHRQPMWERCWDEKAAPDYFTEVIRYRGDYYEAPGFERMEFEHLRAMTYAQYLADVDTVCEFGCGTGHNLKPLQLMGKKVIGFDWAKSAVSRCEEQGIEARRLDMFSPPPTKFHGALLTVHAMEQLGRRWHPFFDYVMRSRPPICVHIEPIEEFYRPFELLDYLALQYHTKRGYLSGYFEHLSTMAERREIELLHTARAYFGSLFHEAYSVVVWRPNS